MNFKTILLVENNPPDVMLVLRALCKVNLADQVDVARDGRQAVDYTFREGEFAEFAATLAGLGVYWLAMNEPPHGG